MSDDSDNFLLIDDIDDDFSCSVTEEDLIEAEVQEQSSNNSSGTESVLASPRNLISGKPFDNEQFKKVSASNVSLPSKGIKSENFEFGRSPVKSNSVSSTSRSGISLDSSGFLPLCSGKDLSLKRTIGNDIFKGTKATSSSKGFLGEGQMKISSNPTPPSSIDKGFLKMEKLRLVQKTRLEAEKEKMEEMDRMIALKKQQNPPSLNMDASETKSRLNAKSQRLDIKRKQMELKMAKERRLLEEERRNLEDQRKILELLKTVQDLERIVQMKKGEGCRRPVRERLGPLPMERFLGEKGSEQERKINEEGEKMMERRKRRFNEGRSYSFQRENKNREDNVMRKTFKALPDDLVLTEVTDAGPVPKERISSIGEEDEFFSSSLPAELILTEFGENGPVLGTGRAGFQDC